MRAEILILPSNDNPNISIYIHWPFCLSKCPYCDFNSHTFDTIDHNFWQKSYLKEIEYFAQVISGKNITSIFFGGGTPSLMNPTLISSIINKLANYGHISQQTEITIEANPTSVESTKFAAFKEAGINRVSLGIQSFDPADLKFLGRNHSANEAIEAIKTAAKHFENYSFDLIYARPHQTLKNWENELKLAINLASKHISLYQLTIEKGTPFYSMYNKGQFIIPDQDEALDLYNFTNEFLATKGYSRYEISNYAVPSFESKHNLNYWQYGEYLGIGPGAHSRISFFDEASQMHRMQTMEMIYNPQNWLKSVNDKDHGIKSVEVLDEEAAIKEILMMGFRLTNGFDNNNFLKFASQPFYQLINETFSTRLVKNKLLRVSANHQSLTNTGLVLHSKIVSDMFENITKINK